MRTTYAVTWREGDGHSASGKLELAESGLRLEGMNADGPVVRDVDYGDIAFVRIARTPAERLEGRPTLVVALRSGDALRICSVAQAGIVAELAERLAALHLERLKGAGRVAIVLPLVPGSSGRVRELLEDGPPFDPNAVGLERHHVFVTDREAVFVFEAPTERALERLAATAGLWTSAEVWSEVAAGPARLAEDAYSWVRPATSGAAAAELQRRSRAPRAPARL